MPGAQAADGREDWKRGTGNVNANVDWLSGWQQSISPIWVDPRILDPRRLVQQDNPTWDSRMRGRNCGVGVAAMWRSTAPVADQLPSRTPNWRFPGFECNGGFDGASELRVGTFWWERVLCPGAPGTKARCSGLERADSPHPGRRRNRARKNLRISANHIAFLLRIKKPPAVASVAFAKSANLQPMHNGPECALQAHRVSSSMALIARAEPEPSSSLCAPAQNPQR